MSKAKILAFSNIVLPLTIGDIIECSTNDSSAGEIVLVLQTMVDTINTRQVTMYLTPWNNYSLAEFLLDRDRQGFIKKSHMKRLEKSIPLFANNYLSLHWENFV